MSAATVAPSTFSPSAFVEQVIEAVLPFVNVDGDNVKEGGTDAQIVETLKPLFGGFTVHDAVIAHFMLEPDSNADADDCEGDSPRQHALYEARTALVNFITNARASSPECAVTRIYFAEDEGDADEATHANFLQAVAGDVRHFRSGRFKGQRFGHTDRWTGGWFPDSMMGDLAPPGMTLEEQHKAAGEGDAA
jgi:hypothetical protein